jgi:hypothetical protein
MFILLIIFPIGSNNLDQSTQDTDFMPLPHNNTIDLNNFSETALYIEQIIADIYANKSLIHNAVVTENPFFLPGIDWTEPDFQGVSMILIQVNNQTDQFMSFVEPWKRTLPHIENLQIYGGFLFSLPNLARDFKTVQMKVFHRIEQLLNIDLIQLPCINSANAIWVPFYATTLETSANNVIIIQQMLNLLPKGGIFSRTISQKEELISEATINAKYFANNLFILNKWSSLSQIQELIYDTYQTINTTTFLNPDFHYIALQNPIYAFIENIIEQTKFSNNPSQRLSVHENNILPNDDVVSLDFIDWKNMDDYIERQQNIVIYDFIYEGNKNGFTEINSSSITFDFFKTMNWEINRTIEINSKCKMNALGWLSGLGITLFQGQILNISPEYFDISSANIIPLQYHLFLNDQTEWIQNFLDFQFRVAFQTNQMKQQLMVWPEKYRNFNQGLPPLLGYILPSGLPIIPGVFIGDIPNICLQIGRNQPQPELEIRKYFEIPLENDSVNSLGSGMIQNVITQNRSWIDFQIQIRNIGTIDAWGVPIRVLEDYGFPNKAPYSLITKALITLGYDPYSMFSTEYPRYFPIDVFGTNEFLGITPDFLQIGILTPYSPEYSDIIYQNREAIATITGLTETYIIKYSNDYNKTNTIYNPKNWRIEPQQTINLSYSQYLQSESPTSSNETFEILYPSVIRYSERTGLQYYETESNSILIKKNHTKTIENENSGMIVNLTQAVTLFAEKTIWNTSSNQYELNLSLIKTGTIPITNATLRFPSIGMICRSPENTTYNTLNNSIYIQTTEINIQENTSSTNFTYGFVKIYDYGLYQASVILNSNESCPLVAFSKNSPSSNPTCHAQTSKINLIAQNYDRIIQNTLRNIKIKIEEVCDITTQPSGLSQIQVNYQILNNGYGTIDEIHINAQSGTNYSEGITLSSILYNNGRITQLQQKENMNISLTFEFNKSLSYLLIPFSIKSNTYWFDSINLSNPLLLGRRSLSLSKVVEKKIIMQNQDILVKILITNEGNLPLTNLIIRDESNHPFKALSLTSGTFLNKIEIINPGDTIEVKYQLKGKTIGQFRLLSAMIDYEYGNIVTEYSNEVQIIIIPSISFWIFSSIGTICLGSLTIVLIKKKEVLMHIIRDGDEK